MVDFILEPRPPLGGFRHAYPGMIVEEVEPLSMCSVATPLGGGEALDAAMRAAYGIVRPAPGRVAVSETAGLRLLGMAADSAFVLFDKDPGLLPRALAEQVRAVSYVTDQSDAWAALRLTGERVRDALERIAMIDLDPQRFEIGAVARTLMEHLSVIVVREEENAYLLLSARSSARSFLHAVTQSAENVL